MELRCALDGAMDELCRGRTTSAETITAATAAADSAESQESEEGEEEEDGTPAKSSTAEVFVLDSDGELENVEEALVASKHEEGVPEMDLKSAGGDVGAAAEEKEEIRAAVSELEDMIVQFLPRAGEGRADLAAAAAAVDGAAKRTPASSAIAIALVCSRCLYAHLATRAAALGSLASSSSSFPRGAEAVKTTRKAREGQERQEEEEEEEEETFLRLLKERCGIGQALKALSVAGRTPPGTGHDADRAEDCAQKQQQQQEQQGGGERPAMPACPTDPRHSKRELAASEQLSTPGRGGGDPQANPLSELEPALALGMEGLPTHGTAGAGAGSTEGKGKGTGQNVRQNSEVPEFLLQLEAGWVLASAVWEGVTLLERARDYDYAVELLSQLLSTRWAVR